jgi:hypothetical protein
MGPILHTYWFNFHTIMVSFPWLLNLILHATTLTDESFESTLKFWKLILERFKLQY